MARLSFRQFLAESLRILRAECPAAYSMVCERLGSRQLSCEVDGERLLLRCTPVGLVIDEASESTGRQPGLVLRTDRAVLRALMAGEETLHQAVSSETLFLRGRAADLCALYEALIGYLRGAARCQLMPDLLRRFLESDRAPGRAPGEERDDGTQSQDGRDLRRRDRRSERGA